MNTFIQRVLSFATLLLIAGAITVGCGPMKYINVQVNDGGQTISVEKHFITGFGTTKAESAWQAGARGDMEEAIRIMKEIIANQPSSISAHYNIAILYEATGNWAKAEKHINRGIEIDKANIAKAKSKRDVDHKLSKELAFIKKYSGQ